VETLRSKPSSCEGCSCYSHGTDFSRVDGTGSLGLMIVAEASGEFEQREGVPLVKWAPAGSILQRAFTRMGLSREQFSLTNCLRCRPKNNFLVGSPWEFSALNHCRPNLDAAIAERRPRAILALGDTALRELTGEAGEARGVGHLCGYVLPGPGANHWLGHQGHSLIPVIPAYHPAFIRRGKAAYQGFFSRNLQRAINVASGKDREWIWDLGEGVRNGAIRYNTHPTLDDAERFLAEVEGNRGLTLSYDIETFESASLDEDARDGFVDTHIRLIQFSVGHGTGFAFPWEGRFRAIAARLLSGSNVKCGHNLWLFDNKVLRAAGEREGMDLLVNGTIHDTLQMFHHWQPDLPAHLQFAAQFVQFPFPWKHLAATDLEFYGCVDVDATLRLYNFLVAMLQKDQIWCGRWSSDGYNDGGYIGQVQQVRPVLAAMEDRGLPVDDVERLKLDGEFDLAQQELDAELQSLCPVEVLGLEPRRGKKGNYDYGYKKTPKDTTGLVLRSFSVACINESTGEPCTRSEERYCRLIPFNPNSWQQLLSYMDARGHKRPKSKKSENEDGSPKDTTEKKELIRLAQRHSDTFYLKVIEYRELSKMRGTYIDGFKPHEDGKVHTTFTFDTGIGQLSSRNPNIQNFPKHGRLAKPVRRMIAAKPGMILTEWDYKSCHVLTLGFLAEDPDYVRIARLDMHSFVTGHALGLWNCREIITESDDQLRARFKWLKSNPEYKHVRDARMKHAILGVGNGLKAKGLFEKHMEDFGSVKLAQSFLDVIESVYPKPFKWQGKMQKLAHEQQFLRTEFGHIRRFYEVWRWDHKKGVWGHGDQAEQAISFWLSNIAFGHIRENMKMIDRTGMAEKYGLCNNVHDSLLFHFPESLLDEHIAEVYPVLSAPSKVLKHPVIAPDGLYIDVDCSVGKNWSEMKEVELDRSKAGYAHRPAPVGEAHALAI
jgi:uracil-DNA glycosylase family 4